MFINLMLHRNFAMYHSDVQCITTLSNKVRFRIHTHRYTPPRELCVNCKKEDTKARKSYQPSLHQSTIHSQHPFVRRPKEGHYSRGHYHGPV